MRRWMVVEFCAAVLLGVAPASAQDRGQLGLTTGYPAAIGALWHASDRVGIRAEATFQTSSSEVESGPLRDPQFRILIVRRGGNRRIDLRRPVGRGHHPVFQLTPTPRSAAFAE